MHGCIYREELDACINWNWTDNKALTKKPKDIWKGRRGPNSKNWLCQLESFNQVGRLWESHYTKAMDDYAVVAFLRPDVLYLDPFPVSLIPQVKVWSPLQADCLSFGGSALACICSSSWPGLLAFWWWKLGFRMEHIP